MILRGTTRAAALAVTLLLGACGGGSGGEVNSTPTPTPTPSPTPTPTVSANDDLIALLVSESFANTASSAAISSSGTQSHSSPTLSVSYDALSDSYTVQVSERSQTFRPADRSSPGNYRRTSGNITDDLTLAPTGSDTYRYVGTGFWQRQTQDSAGAVGGTLDGFVYGVPTNSLVRTGKSFYRTDALGSIVHLGQLLAFNGAGMLEADFAGGNVMAQGTFRFIDPLTGAAMGEGNYAAPLTIASSGNAMTGGITLMGNYRGPIRGQFFGPNAEEVGLSFSGADPDGNVMVGTVRGRTSMELDLGPLQSLPGAKVFDVSYYGRFLGPGLTIDPIAKTYTFAEHLGSPLSGTPDAHRLNISAFSVGPNEKAAVQNSTRFTEYNRVVDGRTMKVLFYNHGSNNSEIQLSYGSFYQFEVGPNASGTSAAFVRHYLYGQATPPSFIPTTGTATYAGPIHGVGEWAGELLYNVSGQSHFTIAFGSGSNSGTLDMLLTPVAGGNDRALTRTIHLGSSLMGGGYSHSQFFGPNAEELGVSFGFLDDFLMVSGVTIAKRQ